jgi:hypothetical protein
MLGVVLRSGKDTDWAAHEQNACCRPTNIGAEQGCAEQEAGSSAWAGVRRR